MGLKQKKYSPIDCGPFAVELTLIAMSHRDKLGPKSLHIKDRILCGMLPWHMKNALIDYNNQLSAEIYVVNDNHIDFLTNNIDQGKPVLLLTNQGAGHWLTLWGYDKENQCFWVFDTRRKAQRNQDGLTMYSFDELLSVWGRQAWTAKLSSWIARKLPMFSDKLNAPPFSVVYLK